MNTKISEAIDAAGLRARYDASVKVFLANKIILAWIMKTCVSEFASYDIPTIMGCIEKREVSTKAVHKDVCDADEIQGINTEDNSLFEQTVYYDIRFYATVPNTEERRIELLINIEAQTNPFPGYPLEKRIVYYLSRMVSGQYGTVFTKSHYEKIEKVYSIWFCSNPPQKRQNTIREITLGQRAVYGDNDIDETVTDLMCGILVNLGDVSRDAGNPILRLMNVLLSDRMPAKDKKTILHEEFDIAMTSHEEGDFTNMCNLSQGIWNHARADGKAEGVILGRAEGKIEGKIEGSANTVKAFSLILGKQHTIAEIAAECDISEQEVRRYCTVLNMTPNEDITV